MNAKFLTQSIPELLGLVMIFIFKPDFTAWYQVLIGIGSLALMGQKLYFNHINIRNATRSQAGISPPPLL
ncbi:MAG: hypothetical protein V4543_08415 [Bacteroidota bacterium]